MEGNDFVFRKEGATLYVYLGFELSVSNSTALREVFEAYRGQDINRIVFDATDLVFLSSSGVRVIIFAAKELGKDTKVIFENCAEEIYNTFKMTGLINFFSFVENKSKINKTGDGEVEDSKWQQEYYEARQKQLDNFAAHNDVVMYQMKMGQNED